MTRVDPRGVFCPSKITRVDLKTLPYMPYGKEMTMSFGLIYIYRERERDIYRLFKHLD